MESKTIGIIIGVAIIVGGGAFWGGMKYQQSQTPARGAGQFTGAQGANRGFRGAQNGGGAFGKIISKDENSVTIELNAPNASSTTPAVSGSKIVLYNNSTEIGKTVSGSANDLMVGQNVSVNGTANSDGSITAEMIQIRPANSPRPGRQ